MRPVLVVLFVAGVVAMVACSGTHESASDRAVPAGTAANHNAPVVDVPSLLSLTIDGITHRLGPQLPVPAGFVDPVLAPLVQRSEHLDSTALFQCRGLALVASYDFQSRRVSDLLLLGSNENELMSRGRLELGAERYLVLPVFQERHPTKLLGLRVLVTTLNQ